MRNNDTSKLIHIEHVNVRLDTELSRVNQTLQWQVQSLERDIERLENELEATKRELHVTKVVARQDADKLAKIQELAETADRRRPFSSPSPYPRDWENLYYFIKDQRVQLPAVPEKT